MNRNMLPLLVAVLALGCVPVLAQGDRKKTSASPNKNLLQQLLQEGASYVIGTDDTLVVAVWKEPELTNTLPVRADGMISMPLLNDVQAAGLTPMQLAASITEKLKQYVEDPHVTVTVAAMNSQKVYLTGEVTRGGVTFLLAPDVPFGPIRDLEDSPQGPIISVPR